MDTPAADLAVIELKCCCCGRVLDVRKLPWHADCVQKQAMWTRIPCAPCRLELQAQALLKR